MKTNINSENRKSRLSARTVLHSVLTLMILISIPVLSFLQAGYPEKQSGPAVTSPSAAVSTTTPPVNGTVIDMETATAR